MNLLRPRCPKCSEELVFCVFAIPNTEMIWPAYVCDCDYRRGEMKPKEIIADIVRQREWLDGSIAINLDVATKEWHT